MRKILALISGIFKYVSSFAQTQEVEMADGLRAHGKIYVIVAIILIILAGLLGYLFLLDRKVKKIEDSLEKGSAQTQENKK